MTPDDAHVSIFMDCHECGMADPDKHEGRLVCTKKLVDVTDRGKLPCRSFVSKQEPPKMKSFLVTFDVCGEATICVEAEDADEARDIAKKESISPYDMDLEYEIIHVEEVKSK